MNNDMKDEDIMPLSPEEVKAIGTIGIGPSKQDIFLNQHYRKLILAGAVVAVAASLGIAYFSHNNDRRDAAGAQVVAAMNTEIPALMHPAADYRAENNERVQTTYADTASAPTAALLSALAELSKGGEAAKGALNSLEGFANDSTAPTLLRARAYCAMATYSMQKGDDTAATQQWKNLLELGETPYGALARMSLGDLAKTAGNKEEARMYYQQAMEHCQTSQLVLDPNIIATRLLLLDVDAPRPQAPAPAPVQTPASFGTPFGAGQEGFSAPAVPATGEIYSNGAPLTDQPTTTTEPLPFN